jgi:hypothetical protein
MRLVDALMNVKTEVSTAPSWDKVCPYTISYMRIVQSTPAKPWTLTVQPWQRHPPVDRPG